MKSSREKKKVEWNFPHWLLSGVIGISVTSCGPQGRQFFAPVDPLQVPAREDGVHSLYDFPASGYPEVDGENVVVLNNVKMFLWKKEVTPKQVTEVLGLARKADALNLGLGLEMEEKRKLEREAAKIAEKQTSLNQELEGIRADTKVQRQLKRESEDELKRELRKPEADQDPEKILLLRAKAEGAKKKIEEYGQRKDQIEKELQGIEGDLPRRIAKNTDAINEPINQLMKRVDFFKGQPNLRFVLKGDSDRIRPSRVTLSDWSLYYSPGVDISWDDELGRTERASEARELPQNRDRMDLVSKTLSSEQSEIVEMEYLKKGGILKFEARIFNGPVEAGLVRETYCIKMSRSHLEDLVEAPGRIYFSGEFLQIPGKVANCDFDLLKKGRAVGLRQGVINATDRNN